MLLLNLAPVRRVIFKIIPSSFFCSSDFSLRKVKIFFSRDATAAGIGWPGNQKENWVLDKIIKIILYIVKNNICNINKNSLNVHLPATLSPASCLSEEVDDGKSDKLLEENDIHKLC